LLIYTYIVCFSQQKYLWISTKIGNSVIGFKCVGFGVLTAVSMKCSSLWITKPCSPLKVVWSRQKVVLTASPWFLASLIFLHRWWIQVPPKRQLTFNALHDVICQKIDLFISKYFLIDQTEYFFPFSHYLPSNPENWISVFLRNVWKPLVDQMEPHLRRQYFS
jgi:hypothetical protein